MARSKIVRASEAALLAVLLIPAIPRSDAGELYAQAIGQPPQRRPPPAAEPKATPTEPAPPAETTAKTEQDRRDTLRTRILIGAGIALALGALGGGGGGGGGETVPEHSP